MAILRHHAAIDSAAPVRLLYSARDLSEVIYRDELTSLADGERRAVTITLTRERGPAWTGRRGRIGAELLAELGWPPAAAPACFVCGPTPFVEAVANALDGARPRSRPHQDRALRTDRRLTPMDRPTPHESPADDRALDGSAAGGPLGEVFAFDVTVARTVCATCRDDPRRGRAAGLPPGARHRPALRLVRRGPAAPRPVGRWRLAGPAGRGGPPDPGRLTARRRRTGRRCAPEVPKSGT